jgi:hypothetical protein
LPEITFPEVEEAVKLTFVILDPEIVSFCDVGVKLNPAKLGVTV